MGQLTEIRIELKGIGTALKEGKLQVPAFQRSYAWEEKHAQELLQDINTAMTQNEPEYFLGSIVVAGKAGFPEVVDGQQRLATTTIILAAIRNYFLQKGETDRAADLERDYLATRELRSQERQPKLRLNEMDHDFFSKRILTCLGKSGESEAATKDSHHRMELALKLATEHITKLAQLSNKPIDQLVDLVYYIETKVRVIWVMVPDYSNAFTVFETLNDRGLDLAITDLLKNHLFHLADDRIKETQQRWTAMYATLETFAEESVAIDYIRQLWSSRHGLVRERDLFDRIKTAITSKQKALDFASDLAKNARLYAAILNTDNELWAEYGTTAKGHMATLNLMGMIQIRPLILAVLSNFSPAEIKKSLKLMVSWGTRFLIVGNVGSGTLENYYSLRAKEVSEGKLKTANDLIKAMGDAVPTDTAFQASFTTASVSKSYLARYYLRVLEKQIRGEAEPELVPNANEEEINLEHVLPQTPSAAWKLDAELAKSLHRRLGNLVLTKTRLNSSLGNNGFVKKKEALATSHFKLTASVKEYTTWGLEQIQKRQVHLAELAVKAWPNKA